MNKYNITNKFCTHAMLWFVNYKKVIVNYKNFFVIVI